MTVEVEENKVEGVAAAGKWQTKLTFVHLLGRPLGFLRTSTSRLRLFGGDGVERA
jgi:hypothetical protein